MNRVRFDSPVYEDVVRDTGIVPDEPQESHDQSNQPTLGYPSRTALQSTYEARNVPSEETSMPLALPGPPLREGIRPSQQISQMPMLKGMDTQSSGSDATLILSTVTEMPSRERLYRTFLIALAMTLTLLLSGCGNKKAQCQSYHEAIASWRTIAQEAHDDPERRKHALKKLGEYVDKWNDKDCAKEYA